MNGAFPPASSDTLWSHQNKVRHDTTLPLLLQGLRGHAIEQLRNGCRTSERNLLDDLVFTKLTSDGADILLGGDQVDDTRGKTSAVCELSVSLVPVQGSSIDCSPQPKQVRCRASREEA